MHCFNIYIIFYINNWEKFSFCLKLILVILIKNLNVLFVFSLVLRLIRHQLMLGGRVIKDGNMIDWISSTAIGTTWLVFNLEMVAPLQFLISDLIRG